jgi:hypothetical protein
MDSVALLNMQWHPAGFLSHTWLFNQGEYIVIALSYNILPLVQRVQETHLHSHAQLSAHSRITVGGISDACMWQLQHAFVRVGGRV